MSNISLQYLRASCALDCSQQLENDEKDRESGALLRRPLGSTRLLLFLNLNYLNPEATEFE